MHQPCQKKKGEEERQRGDETWEKEDNSVY